MAVMAGSLGPALSWAGLLAYVLRFDAPFRIIGLAELVDAARELADRLTGSNRRSGAENACHMPEICSGDDSRD
ncbi:hypothetical protein MF406_04070 [Georgenia sp. TF02-10]|uniref:hypothetical protein n=1 Tax=Georgenia sp. TF02-10 TaxID=2917725 RepID=UPI001FA7A818|nr:hypothetical protein [Georgenia sp. TF02-10]UNX55451.1 hypothetical protein MF406_04070 [Georgenia sp. TF02-10]